MFNKETLYCLNDVTIMPAPISSIRHRSEINIYDENGMLPLFTAPMLNVVGKDSYKTYIKNKIYPIIPRTESLKDRIDMCGETWCAFGLDEFKENFMKKFSGKDKMFGRVNHVLIDIANGNMEELVSVIKKAKSENGKNLTIIAGNIGNPETYRNLAESGCDYVRLSIGTGDVCITASNTGIFVPPASLIDMCYKVKKEGGYNTKIIMDGGMKNYDDIIKALALGADYVMCGSIFNKMVEASGKIMEMYGNEVPQDYVMQTYKYKDFYRTYFGMSTKTAQLAMGKDKEHLHTSEGRYKRNKIEYTMGGWVENFEDYLRSNMSYSNVRDIKNYNQDNVEIYLQSKNSVESRNK